MTNMTKETHSAKALLEESLRNASASIPLDLWGAVAIRAMHEPGPCKRFSWTRSATISRRAAET
jgi:hypothetical protein